VFVASSNEMDYFIMDGMDGWMDGWIFIVYSYEVTILNER